ncbi:hypothetical protein IAU60_006083 [Kwoniella sp. DSM 27419]
MLYTPVSQSATSLPSNQKGPFQTAFVSLWKQQVLAIVMGSLTLAIGSLGLAAYFSLGPLYYLFIPAKTYTGPVINAPNVGALIAGIAAAICACGGLVAAGVARAWLRRKAVRGEGPLVKQWKILSTGGAILDAVRSPLTANGLTLVITLAMAANGPVLAGVALPNAREHLVRSSYGPVIPYLNNGAYGNLVDCVRITENRTCATWLGMPTLLKAFDTGSRTIGSSDYEYQYYPVSSSGYLAAVLPTSITPRPSDAYDSMSIVAPVSSYNATCYAIEDVGVKNDQYYYQSTCYPTGNPYGYASVFEANFITGSACRQKDLFTYIVEIAVGGPDFAHGDNVTGTYAIHCEINGFEGLGIATYTFGGRATIAIDPTSNMTALQSNDMRSTVSAVIAAVKSEGGLQGKLGTIAGVLKRNISAGKIDLVAVTYALNNALAASATTGYNFVAGSSPDDTYPNPIPSLASSWVYNGYGWTKTPRSLGWSILCIAIGIVWFCAAGYMVGGGTRYDPSDWYQTVNTAAGSGLHQKPGTCAGGKHPGINKEALWYGELKSSHVGFSKSGVTALRCGERYGAL